MLTHDREYGDGKYSFKIVPIGEAGNLIKLENMVSNKIIKQYFTKDDETAFVIFESLLDCYRAYSDEGVEKYKYKEQLPSEFQNRIVSSEE